MQRGQLCEVGQLVRQRVGFLWPQNSRKRGRFFFHRKTGIFPMGGFGRGGIFLKKNTPNDFVAKKKGRSVLFWSVPHGGSNQGLYRSPNPLPSCIVQKNGDRWGESSTGKMMQDHFFILILMWGFSGFLNAPNTMVITWKKDGLFCNFQTPRCGTWLWFSKNTPKKITCPLKRDHFGRKWIIFQPSIFRWYISFRGSNSWKKFSLSLGMFLGVSCLSPGAKIQPNLKPSIHSRLLQSFGGVGHPHEEGGWMSSLLSEAGSKGGKDFLLGY